MIVCSMAKQRKTKILKRGLGELDQQEKDYLENLANSLLQLQNADLPRKAERQKKGKSRMRSDYDDSVT